MFYHFEYYQVYQCFTNLNITRFTNVLPFLFRSRSLPRVQRQGESRGGRQVHVPKVPVSFFCQKIQKTYKIKRCLTSIILNGNHIQVFSNQKSRIPIVVRLNLWSKSSESENKTFLVVIITSRTLHIRNHNILFLIYF